VNPGDLWPAAVLVALPLPLGLCAGFLADAWLSLRHIRAAIRGDRIPG
jgi:hypothetical protein